MYFFSNELKTIFLQSNNCKVLGLFDTYYLFKLKIIIKASFCKISGMVTSSIVIYNNKILIYQYLKTSEIIFIYNLMHKKNNIILCILVYVK